MTVLDQTILEQLRRLGQAVNQPGENVLVTLINLFENDSQRRVRDLEQAWHHGDNPTAARAAHTVKGAAANLGAVVVVERARDIEMQINAHQPLNIDAVNSLRDAVAVAVAALRNTLAVPPSDHA